MPLSLNKVMDMATAMLTNKTLRIKSKKSPTNKKSHQFTVIIMAIIIALHLKLSFSQSSQVQRSLIIA